MTSPASRSFEPWMMTAGALRRSAYFICAFMPEEPRYISARIPALRRSETIFWYSAIWSRSMTSTTTGPAGLSAPSLPSDFSAAARRETPMEKPVAGTSSPRKRATRPS